MSSLSSSSTLTAIVAAYIDNASYDEDGSTAKARTFITACRILLVRRAKRVVHAGEEVELDLGQIDTQLSAAKRWLAANRGSDDGGGGIKHADFADYRL